MNVLDRVTETAGRWLAARTSRRSLLGWTGRAAVVAAGGTAMAGVFQRQAQARVCGQSGVSPKCPTYDCYPPDFWGWCWYASPGCCANGGIKKICDCCRTGWPNVQGYCPGGSSVYCIVESCLEDPRVMRVPVERFNGPSTAEVSLQRSRLASASSVQEVVVGDATDPRAAAMAAPVAAALDAPLLLADPAAPTEALVAELQRLGVSKATVVGTPLLGGVYEALTRTLSSVVVPHEPLDIASASVGVANWLLGRTGGRRVWCIGGGGVASESAAAVGALAMTDRAPIVIGVDALSAVRNGPFGGGLQAVYAGPEPRAGAPAGADVVEGDTAVDVTANLARRALAQAGTGRTLVVLVPARTPGVASALVAPGAAVALHDDGVVSSGLRDWCNAVRGSVALVDVATGVPGSLPDQGVYDLQSAFNGFDAHQLTGVAGQGLPVYAQPMEEREMGRARVAGPLPSTTTTSLVARANPLRQPGAPPIETALTTTVPVARVRVAAPVTKVKAKAATTTTKPKSGSGKK